MVELPSKTAPPLSRQTLPSLNSRIGQPVDRSTVSRLNEGGRRGNSPSGPHPAGSVPPARTAAPARPGASTAPLRPASTSRPAASTPPPRPAPSRTAPPSRPAAASSAPRQAPPPGPPAPADLPVPRLVRPLRQGQKTALAPQGGSVKRLRACFGWNVRDGRCDVDASAFLVGPGGRVPGDSWFVFYGQRQSPDGSTAFQETPGGPDREVIRVDLDRLDPGIRKIVFVLTINEAFEHGLNFSMLRDAYVRVMDAGTGQELLSYRLEEYYEAVTSMTIGELYLHNGQWKFNPVGNGVHQDLAGQCAIYGVEIS